MTDSVDLYTPGAASTTSVNPDWQHKTSLVIGFDASSCDFVCDGVADDVQIQAAVDYAAANGYNVIFLRRGFYNIVSGIVLPKDPALKIVGEKSLVRSASQGVIIRNTSGNPLLQYIFYIAGDASSDSSDDNAAGAIFTDIYIDGQGYNGATSGTECLNSAGVVVRDCGLTGIMHAFYSRYVGIDPPTSSSVTGGHRILDTNVGVTDASGNVIHLEYTTQCWIIGCWFESVVAPNAQVYMKSCNKTKVVGNELNDATYGIYETDTATVGNFANEASGNFNGAQSRHGYSFSHVSSMPIFKQRLATTHTPNKYNSGATFYFGSAEEITLPSAEPGLIYTFVAGTGEIITIAPATGDQIDLMTATTGKLISGGYGHESVTLQAITVDKWQIVAINGQWNNVREKNKELSSGPYNIETTENNMTYLIGGTMTFNLPACEIGLRYVFISGASGSVVTIAPDGTDLIRLANTNIVSNNTGNETLILVCVTSTKWQIESQVGTWT